MGKDQRSKEGRERQYLSRACTYIHVHICMPGQVHVYVHVGMSSEAKTNAQGPMQKVADPEVVNDILSRREQEEGGGTTLLLLLLQLQLQLLQLLPPLPPLFDNDLDRYHLLHTTPAPLETRTVPQAPAFHQRLPKMLRRTAKHCRWSLTLPVTCWG